MLFNPLNSRKQLEVKFSKLQKLNYNQFRWWRMYDNPNKPLDKYQPLRDRILNGDFEYSHFKPQAEWCEHEMNDAWKECYPDIGKYNEKTSMLRSRRKRLLEDFEKDESEKLRLLTKGFTDDFNITLEQVYVEIEGCFGDMIDLYYIIEDKYRKKIKSPTRRGRPKRTI
jgi:hypothetical protein